MTALDTFNSADVPDRALRSTELAAKLTRFVAAGGKPTAAHRRTLAAVLQLRTRTTVEAAAYKAHVEAVLDEAKRRQRWSRRDAVLEQHRKPATEIDLGPDEVAELELELGRAEALIQATNDAYRFAARQLHEECGTEKFAQAIEKLYTDTVGKVAGLDPNKVTLAEAQAYERNADMLVALLADLYITHAVAAGHDVSSQTTRTYMSLVEARPATLPTWDDVMTELYGEAEEREAAARARAEAEADRRAKHFRETAAQAARYRNPKPSKQSTTRRTS